MALGTQSGGKCFPSQAEAAASWCSGQSSFTASGSHLSCVAVSEVSAEVGGPVVFSWTRRSVAADGSASSVEVEGQRLFGCETYGFDYFAPAVSAAVVAAVAVLAAKAVYRFVFSRESV